MDHRFVESKALLERAYAVIPSATQTFSKGPTQWVRGVSPHYLVRGEGAWVWDADGNRFLDYLMALGPIILGYGNQAVNDAILKQVHDGPVFSQMHPLEVEVAEMMTRLIPNAEMVRFGKTGADATTGAIRAARALTGRDRVALCSYHGWHDWYIGTTTRAKGVPKAVAELSHAFPYNNLGSLEALFERYPGEIAAVILEPIGVESPLPGFLQGLRKLTREKGALLIFDEVVTGFRLALGGAQQYFDVEADLCCFGKALANGMPLSAITGPRQHMEVFDEIFYSGTFGGETLSLAAAKATVEELQRRDVIAHNWKFGERLMELLRSFINQHGLNDAVKVLGLPVRSVTIFPHADERVARVRRSYFMQECVKRNLLYFCSHAPCFAHDEQELAFTEKVLREVFPLFAAAYQADDFESRLEGPCVEAIFRRA